ncbi:MAG: hypothetical protein U1F81_15670 [Verrucomicrobiaceae bacterium]
METGKFFFIIAFVVAVAGIFTIAQHFQGIDAANAVLIESKSKLSQLKESLAVRQDEWVKIEAVAAKAQQATTLEAPLLQELDELKAKHRRVEADFKYMVSSIRSTVDKVRVTAIGSEYPEVQLTTGKTLKLAKIKKMDAMNISFIHADGFTIVPYDQLPEEIRERFDMGGSGLAEQIAAAEQAVQTAKYAPVPGGRSDSRASADNFGVPGLQTVQGLTINCPIPLSRAPTPAQTPAPVKLQLFTGKEPVKEIDAVVMVMDGPSGKKIDLEKVVQDSINETIKSGLSKASHSMMDLTVSGHSAKKTSLSGISSGQPCFIESLYIQSDGRIYMVQIGFTAKDPKNRETVTAILSSAKVE